MVDMVDQDEVASEPYASVLDQDLVASDVLARPPPTYVSLMALPPSQRNRRRSSSSSGSSSTPYSATSSSVSLVDCSASLTACNDSGENTRFIKRLKMSHWRQKVRIAELKNQLKSVRSQSTKTDRTYAGILVSAVRNQGHGSAAAAATWSEVLSPGHGIGRVSVNRWELVTGTIVLTDMALYHAEQESLFSSSKLNSSQWTATISHLCGDATRSRAWREHKVQCLQMVMTYVHSSFVVSKECWPDVQLVYDATARGCYRIVRKQLRLVQSSILDTPLFADQLGLKQIRFLNLVGDCGSDQAGFREIVGRQYQTRERVLVVGLPCFAHQLSLSEGRVLAMSDMCMRMWSEDFTFYSVLVKKTHLWRSKPELIHRAAVLRSGQDAMSPLARRAKRKCPCACQSRWDSVMTVLEYFLGFEEPERNCRCLMSDVFFLDLVEVEWKPGATKPVDDVRLDEINAHKEKETRWRSHVKSAIRKATYWLMMHITHLCMSPLSHTLRHLEKKPKDPNQTALSLLVCGKGATIMAEFQSVLTNTSCWLQHAERCDHIFVEQMHCAVVSMLCVAAGEFYRRIMLLITEFPLLLLWLPERPPNKYCADRQRVATTLLDRELHSLDVTSAKVRRLFAGELKQTKADGTLCPQVHRLFLNWRKQLKDNAQVVESANSIITKMTAMAPYMDHPLLACRLCQKKKLTTDGGDHGCILDLALLGKQLYKTNRYNAVMNYPERWLELDETKRHHPMPLMDDIKAAHTEVATELALPPGTPCHMVDADPTVPVPVEAVEPPSSPPPLEELPPVEPLGPPPLPPPEEAPPVEPLGPPPLAPPSEGPPAAAHGARVDGGFTDCSLFTAKSRPLGVTFESMTKSARAALRWSYNFPVQPALTCFWIAGTATLVMNRLGNLDHLLDCSTYYPQNLGSFVIIPTTELNMETLTYNVQCYSFENAVFQFAGYR